MTAPVNEGDILAGKYRVERVLGMGGMGVVVAATHLHLDQKVALKFLLPEITSNPELVARFSREARAAVKIQSEHVARVLDVGTLDNGAPYMVMEYLEGRDLSEVVRNRGPLPWQEAVEHVLQACEALAEAHVAGVVHRDLKPANLFLIRRADGSPCIKVLDFGISKAATKDGASGANLTQTSAMIGSPKYMSPEQLKSSRDVDARTDIWSLGIILYELLSGEGAFRADTMPQLYVSILQDQPQPLRRNDIPTALHHVILRCLEKDVARRFQSVAELATALGEFAPPQSRVSVERVSRILQSRSDTVGFGGSPPQLGSPSAVSSGPRIQAQGLQPTVAGSGYPPTGYAAPALPPGPPQGYGMPAGYPPQMPMGMSHPTVHPHHPQGPSAGYPGYPQPTQHSQRSATHPAAIVLITLAAIFVLSMGGCVVCVCIGAASQ